MKYSPSVDGIDRININVQLRFSRQDLDELKPLAKNDGYTSVTKWIRDNAPAAWENFEVAQWDNIDDDES